MSRLRSKPFLNESVAFNFSHRRKKSISDFFNFAWVLGMSKSNIHLADGKQFTQSNYETAQRLVLTWLKSLHLTDG